MVWIPSRLSARTPFPPEKISTGPHNSSILQETNGSRKKSVRRSYRTWGLCRNVILRSGSDEESQAHKREILRYAQDDNGGMTLNIDIEDFLPNRSYFLEASPFNEFSET